MIVSNDMAYFSIKQKSLLVIMSFFLAHLYKVQVELLCSLWRLRSR